MALQGCHKLCLRAVRSTPHWPVIGGGLPPGKGHNLWQREVLREGLSWGPQQPSLPAVGQWVSPPEAHLGSTTPHPLLQFPNHCSALKTHIYQCLTMKSTLTLCSLLHTWDTATIPTLALTLSEFRSQNSKYILLGTTFQNSSECREWESHIHTWLVVMHVLLIVKISTTSADLSILNTS